MDNFKINNLDQFITDKDDEAFIKDFIKGVYKSPITIASEQIAAEIDNEVIRAVHRVSVDVDKEELIKALNYDRQQYDVGYKDGYNKGFQVAIEMVKQNIDKAIGEALEKQREDYTQAISDIASKINE